MRKKNIFIILLIICIAALFSVKNYDYVLSRRAAFAQTAPGLFVLDHSVSPFNLNFYLSGEWEYYPNELIFSDHSEKQISGEIRSADPRENYNRNYYHQESILPENSYALEHTSVDLNPDAHYISVPSGHLFRTTAHTNQASYRMVIKGIEQVTDGKEMLCFSGLTNGNIRIFANGREAVSMSSPYGYPAFYLPPSENIEIVIEVTNTSQVLNICPRICYIGIAMPYMDGNKNYYILLFALLIAIWLILTISSAFLDAPQYRFWAIPGLFFSGVYIVQNIWVSGYLDSITAIFPLALLHTLSGILILLGMFFFYIILRKYYCEFYPIQLCRIGRYCCLAAIILQVLAFSMSLSSVILIAVLILTLLPIAGWAIFTVKYIHRMIWEQVLIHYGTLILFTGIGVSLIHNHFNFANNIIYILPVCILTFIIFIFASGCIEKQRSLTHTRQLLELEKNMMKMQTSMLANQIKPHFLYNTLTTIQEMCYTRPEQAAEMIVYFSNYLRTNIDFMENNDLIPFSRELNHIQNYMYIQNARFNNAIQFETYIRTDDFMLPPLTIQPLIENAIKYGIRKNSNHGWVHLETGMDADKLYITIENSGPGFDPGKQKAHHSIENIRVRMDSLLHAHLYIESQEGTDGTKVSIYIPRTYVKFTSPAEQTLS